MTELDDIRKRTDGYTPGPWVDRGLCTTAEYHWWSVQLPGNREVQVEGMTSQEAVSNCALIAAAPDLLRLATEQEAELAEAATLMKVLVDVVDAHDIDSLSCDRDGKEYCDCLSRAVGHIQGFLARKEAKR